MKICAFTQPLIDGLAAGRWDRFCTFGEKMQDGQKFTFSVSTLSQIVDNFARLYRGRRLGMDYEHQTVNAPSNGQPAPELARYNALAVVRGGKVVKFYSQDPLLAQPNPARLLTEIRARFPEDPDADGLWGYRCEHTPLGRQLLPNYSQISPLFSSEGTDEQERPIGYSLLNVSAVNVAFQDRTVLNLRLARALAASSNRTSVLRHLGLAEDTADEQVYAAVAKKLGISEEQLTEEADRELQPVADIQRRRMEQERRENVAYGVSRVGVVGLALSQESRRLLALGEAPDIGAAQLLAVRRNPALGRR